MKTLKDIRMSMFIDRGHMDEGDSIDFTEEEDGNYVCVGDLIELGIEKIKQKCKTIGGEPSMKKYAKNKHESFQVINFDLKKDDTEQISEVRDVYNYCLALVELLDITSEDLENEN